MKTKTLRSLCLCGELLPATPRGDYPIVNHRRMKMDRNFGLYIVLGLVIGAVFGVPFGPAIGNTTLAIALGAFGGVFVGWFIAAAVLEDSKGKSKTGDQ